MFTCETKDVPRNCIINKMNTLKTHPKKLKGLQYLSTQQNTKFITIFAANIPKKFPNMLNHTSHNLFLHDQVHRNYSECS